MPRRAVTRPPVRFLKHTYPSFYACYLLKSLAKTYKGRESKTNYIGSTPDPPKRIRQHNGEISAGAMKTSRRRPWVMQLIVYGFPSRMAALQFEWAFQYPWLSRHLKDNDGNSLFSKHGRYLKRNVEIARTMVCTHPYDKLALHVKLFTKEARDYWSTAEKSTGAPPLPKGSNVSIELEGVDGKSGRKGTGRTGAIDTNDGAFTSAHLRKNTSLIANHPNLTCFFCTKELTAYSTAPLDHALCPNHDCTLVAHLKCLADHFLAEPPASDLLIPRGGTCPSCTSYVLWGDVAKGCYRRAAGGVDRLEEDETSEPDADVIGSGTDDEPVAPKRTKAKGRRVQGKGKAKESSNARRKVKKTKADDSSEGEFFDFEGIEPDHDRGEIPPTSILPATPRKRGRPPKNSSSVVSDDSQDLPVTPRKRGRPPNSEKKSTGQSPATIISPKRRGRPPKDSASQSRAFHLGPRIPPWMDISPPRPLELNKTSLSAAEPDSPLGRMTRSLSVLSLSSTDAGQRRYPVDIIEISD